MRVYIVRHGESETNCAKKWTGWLDVKLTEKGRADAKRAGDILKSISFDKIYTSDLKRAMETAENAIPGCRYETSPLLREISVGSLAGMPLDTLTEEQKENAGRVGYAEFGGESKEEFYERIKRFMKELEAQECENTAVFCHGGWIHGMFNTVLGAYIPRKRICCYNCTVAVFEYSDKAWKLHSWINPV